METISEMPGTTAAKNAVSPRNDTPNTVGSTEAACVIAELRIIALTISAKRCGYSGGVLEEQQGLVDQ